MSIYHAKNRYAHSVAYYALNLDSFDMTDHRHNRCEIMYLVDGTCTVVVDGTPLLLHSKQFVFLDQQIPHRLEIEPSTPCTLLNYEFSCSDRRSGTDLVDLAAHSEAFQHFLDGRARYLLLYDRGKLGYALKDLIGELEQNNEDDYLLSLLFCRMFIELTKCSSTDSTLTGITYLKQARKYITEHFAEDISVAEVAHAVGINHSYLQVLFSKQFGCGIMTYVNNQRMDRATFLLKNSNMNVTDIAFEVGFNSRQHFGYTFEKRFAMSPKQYRKLNGQNIQTDTGTYQHMLAEDGGPIRSFPLKGR